MILALLSRPAVRWAIAGLGAVILIAGLILWATKAEQADDRHNQQIGAQVERSEAAQATLDNVRKANDAEATIRSDPDAALAECLRHARNPKDC